MSNLNADTLIDLLFIHFNVTTMADLAMHISVSQQTISKWKQRNSVNAIKKKCIELGIYSQIFGEVSSARLQSIGTINNSNVAQNAGEQYNGTVTGQNHTDIDKLTFAIFKETYLKALEKGKIQDFGIYIMKYENKNE